MSIRSHKQAWTQSEKRATGTLTETRRRCDECAGRLCGGSFSTLLYGLLFMLTAHWALPSAGISPCSLTPIHTADHQQYIQLSDPLTDQCSPNERVRVFVFGAQGCVCMCVRDCVSLLTGHYDLGNKFLQCQIKRQWSESWKTPCRAMLMQTVGAKIMFWLQA